MPINRPEDSRRYIEASAALLNVISNGIRLQILGILLEKETSVGELSLLIGISKSALSQHLGRLRDAELVVTQRETQYIYYHCNSRAVAQILATLHGIFASEMEAVPQLLDRYDPQRRI